MSVGKILFLDIDSVMVVYPDNLDIPDPPRTPWGNFQFTEECVAALNDIITQTGCRIVLSADMREKADMDDIREMFRWHGISKVPVDKTGTVRNNNIDHARSQEILDWVEKNNPQHWVAVDDLVLDDGPYKELMSNHFVSTKEGIHLTKDRIIHLLSHSTEI